jgi:2-aminoethylphosphonate-pyruvate transaminase
MNSRDSNDPLLFTPGPLTTSRTVKEAMLHDAGSWHGEFNAKVHGIREQLLAVAGVTRAKGWETVLLQGSGTFGVESVFASCVPPDGKVCLLANGAYGERIAAMLSHLRIEHTVLRSPEHQPHAPEILESALIGDRGFTHLAMVHCETTTGILNPVEPIGRVARRHGLQLVVDAMSSFGAVELDLEAAGVDFLISSPNKCLEGVPGFCFVIGRRAALLANESRERSLSLSLAGQLRGFEKNGQFRYTPPTHTLLAFEQALKEHAAEGGVPARGARYRRNHALLLEGMQRLGFKPYLPAAVQSYIITAFHYPADPHFQFHEFYRRLSDKGFLIYPGKLSSADTFRIGNIGHLFELDIRSLLTGIEQVLEEMSVRMPRRDSAAVPAA